MSSPQPASIRIACPGCKKVFQVPAAAGGRRARCRHCNQVLTIPQPKAPQPQAPAPDPFAEFFDEAMSERTVSGLISTPTVTPSAPVPQSPKISTYDQAPERSTAVLPCDEADAALNYAIVGLFCCGIVLGPAAVMKAINAKRMIAMNPRLSGSGKATAALVIGIVVTIFAATQIIGVFAQIGNR